EATRLAIGSPEIFIGSGSTSLKAVARALKPGGGLVSYNLSPAPNAAGKPYRPMADGRCPFSAKDLAAAGFETLLRDGVDDKAARALGAARSEMSAASGFVPEARLRRPILRLSR